MLPCDSNGAIQVELYMSLQECPQCVVYCCPQLPIVKAACCDLIEQSLCEETVPSSLEIADRCLNPIPQTLTGASGSSCVVWLTARTCHEKREHVLATHSHLIGS